MRSFRIRRSSRQRAFSLVEALITSLIFVSLLVAVYEALGDSLSFSGVQSTYTSMQMEARKALDKMSNEIRMSGWVTTPAQFPYIFTNGVATGYFASESHAAPAQHVTSGNAFGPVTEIVFKIPQDKDGDGLLTAAGTGAIEWSTFDVSYVIESDASGINTLERRQNGVVTDILARYVERMTIATINTDATVGINEVVITLYMVRPTVRGQLLQTSLTTCVSMRNVEEVH
jgi:Tfp pilus assembly protein PilW